MDKLSRAEVHQIAENEREAELMKVAWSMVLGRMKQSLLDGAVSRRAQRAKRS